MVGDETVDALEARGQRRSFGAQHFGLIASTGVVVAFAIHLIFVARGSRETTLALVRFSSPTTVLIPFAATVLASTLAISIAITGPSILCDPRMRPEWAEPIVPRVVAWVTCLIPLFFLASAATALVVIGMTPGWLWGGPAEARAWADIKRKADAGDEKARRRIKRRQRFQFRNWRTWLITFGLLLGATALASGQPWLPSERITTSTGPVIGYVVAESDRDLVVLVDDDRTITRVALDNDVTRTFCTIGREPRTLASITVWRNKPDYPRCDA